MFAIISRVACVHAADILVVRRCVAKTTRKQYAAKRVSAADDTHSPYLVDNEVDALVQAKGLELPRVVKYIETTSCSMGDMIIILEWVAVDVAFVCQNYSL